MFFFNKKSKKKTPLILDYWAEWPATSQDQAWTAKQTAAMNKVELWRSAADSSELPY
jgi:hypothetical protein